MKKTFVFLLSVPLALAHAGESVEQHNMFVVLFDSTVSFFTRYGARIFGVLFGLAVALFLFWIFRKK